MAEEEVNIEEVPEEETDSNYKPPAEKSIGEMLEQDQNDESLNKYKQALLGSATEGSVIVGKLQLILLILGLIPETTKSFE